MRVSTAEAKWYEDRNHWKVNVQKDGVRRSFYDSTPGKRGKAKCEAKAREWLCKVSVTDPRFDVAWEQFLERKKKKVGAGRYESIEGYGRIWLLPELGRKRLSAITEQMIQDILDDMGDQGRAIGTVDAVRRVYLEFEKFCRKNRYELEMSFDLSVDDAKPKKEKLVLSPENIATVFSDPNTRYYGSPKRDHYINAYRFALLTGARRGEITGLKWEDVTDSEIKINRSVNRMFEITDGKTGNARRSIPITAYLSKILEDQKAYLKEIGMISPYVFPAKDNPEINDPLALSSSWNHYVESHGFPAVTFHGLRHTMISLYKADMPEELLKQVVGHSASMDTFGVYGHKMDSDTQRIIDTMDDVFGKILKHA